MNNFLKNQIHISRGVTLLEIIIVSAVVGVLVLIILPQFSKIKENQVLKSGVENVLSSLDKARTNTLSSLNSSEYGVHFQSDKVIIFTGKVFSPVAGDNEEIDITAPVSITDVTLGGVSDTEGDVYFTRLSGVPSDVGTITISTSSQSKVITISATGAVSVN